MLAMIFGFVLSLALVALAVVVQWRRPPEDGVAIFVYVVGVLVFLAITGLLTIGGH